MKIRKPVLCKLRLHHWKHGTGFNPTSMTGESETRQCTRCPIKQIKTYWGSAMYCGSSWETIPEDQKEWGRPVTKKDIEEGPARANAFLKAKYYPLIPLTEEDMKYIEGSNA